MAISTVVVLGGYGTFGRLISEQLAKSSGRVIVAGRSQEQAAKHATEIGADHLRCDFSDANSLAQAIERADLVVNAAGPFQARDYSIPLACIERGRHYVDLGDGRDYVSDISQLDARAKEKGVFVCVGASTTPAITSAVVAELLVPGGDAQSIRVALSAGNRIQAGVSTIASILDYVGKPVRVWRKEQWCEQRGWGLAEFYRFPPPVNVRRVQLCDVPDLELFPARFGAAEVLFKAGVEMTVFNFVISGLAGLRRVIPAIHLPALARPVVKMSQLFKWLGTTHGSFAVEVIDRGGQSRSLAIVAPENGPRVPSSPAVLLSQKLLAGDLPTPGAYPCMGFLSLSEFAEHLRQFGIHVVRGEGGRWKTEEAA